MGFLHSSPHRKLPEIPLYPPEPIYLSDSTVSVSYGCGAQLRAQSHAQQVSGESWRLLDTPIPGSKYQNQMPPLEA